MTYISLGRSFRRYNNSILIKRAKHRSSLTFRLVNGIKGCNYSRIEIRLDILHSTNRTGQEERIRYGTTMAYVTAKTGVRLQTGVSKSSESVFSPTILPEFSVRIAVS